MFKKIVFFFYFNLFFNFKYLILCFNYDDAILPPENTTGSYPKFSDFQLNYENKCGEVFKYKKNNERDIVFFGYKFRGSYREKDLLSTIYSSLDSFKHSIPNAKIICFIPKNQIYRKIVKILKEFNITIIPFEGYYGIHIVTSRFFLIQKYLNENKDKYDRILLSDLGDVYVLNDIFSTFSEDELFLNKECFYYLTKNETSDCIHMVSFNTTRKWLNKFFDGEIHKNLTERNPVNLNAGIIMGGTEKILKFLNIFLANLENINKRYLRKFGYDQTILNYLYYYNYFDSIPLKLETCSQRTCFRARSLRYNKNTTKIIFEEDKCSPVLFHKFFPDSWRNNEINNYNQNNNNNNQNINQDL